MADSTDVVSVSHIVCDPGAAKNVEEFYNHTDGPRYNNMKNFYFNQRSQQTYDFATSTMKKYEHMDKLAVDPWTALELGSSFIDSSQSRSRSRSRRKTRCNSRSRSRSTLFIDESDPDTELGQIYHSFQVAEAIRKAFPDEEKYGWLHLTGLIHDLCKILTPVFNEPQWANVGDSFPVGCMFERVGVFPEYFDHNPDLKHPVYSTQLGIYQQGCGLNNLTMAFGHDEYLYKVLTHEKNATQLTEKQLPIQAYYIIRFNSFYPWHKFRGYTIFENELDKENKEWVQMFASFDLYSKSHNIVDIEKVKPYYEKLMKQYLPAKLYF